MDKYEELINKLNADVRVVLDKYYGTKGSLKTLQRRYDKRGEEIKLLKREIKDLKRQLSWFDVT